MVDLMKKLHPERSGPLQLPPVSGPQLAVDEASVRDRLFGDDVDSSLSKDVFGWAPWLLFPWRAEPDGFFTVLVRFCCLIVNQPALFPAQCGAILASGALPLA